MEAAIKSLVATRIFMGAAVTSELRMHLQQSKEWRQETIQRTDTSLQETHFKGKDYVGFYLPDRTLALEELSRMEKGIREKLQRFCPAIDAEMFRITLFPQVFIS